MYNRWDGEQRVLVLDMDGTIADTYNYPDWVGILRGHVDNPYIDCGKVDPLEVYNMFLNVKPLISPEELEKYINHHWCNALVFSMTPWDASDEINQVTTNAKILWLRNWYPFLNNILITRNKDDKSVWDDKDVIYKGFATLPDYWTPNQYDTLIDDNETILNNFVGYALTPPWVNRIL